MKLIVTIQRAEEIPLYAKAGAQEILISLEGYGASALPSFSLQEVPSLEKVCQDHGVTLSFLMNRLFFPEECNKVLQTFEQLQSSSGKIYFSDLACMEYAKKLQMTSRLVYQPDTLLVSAQDCAWWKSQGVTPSISPLVPLDDVLGIGKEVEGCEVFLHGYSLMSASKRPLLHAYLNKSLQKGTKYSLIEQTREGKMPIVENDSGTWVYTDTVQQSFSEISSFEKVFSRARIDTIFMDTTYGVDTIALYRKTLDHQASPEDWTLYEKKYAEIPFDKGYYEKRTVL